MLAEGSALAWLAMTALAVAVAVLVTHRSPGRAGPVGAATAGARGRRERRLRAPAPPPSWPCSTSRATLFPLHRRRWRAAHLLVFVTPGCGPCARIAPLVPGWAEYLSPIRVKAVVLGEPTMLEGDLAVLRGHAYFDPYDIARAAFGVGTPVGRARSAPTACSPVVPPSASRTSLDFVAEVRDHLREAVAAVDAAVEVSDAP